MHLMPISYLTKAFLVNIRISHCSYMGLGHKHDLVIMWQLSKPSMEAPGPLGRVKWTFHTVKTVVQC